jgi:hypothetical protein|tara:strand:+ start:625 stop:852 length:228 start_codon:yes stop_codon:yes gene_type:complete
MKETTKAHIRKQSSLIEDIVGVLQVLAETNLSGKEAIQQRLTQLGTRLDTISDSLREIEQSEDLQWLEDKAGVDA